MRKYTKVFNCLSLTAVLIGICFCFDSLAVDKVIHTQHDVIEVETVCVNGYLFVIASGYRGTGITQVFEEGGAVIYPPQPVKCK